MYVGLLTQLSSRSISGGTCHSLCSGSCNNHIGQGVRYNAHKTQVGSYYSTPVWAFRCKCHLCQNWFEIRTDPQVRRLAHAEYALRDRVRRAAAAPGLGPRGARRPPHPRYVARLTQTPMHRTRTGRFRSLKRPRRAKKTAQSAKRASRSSRTTLPSAGQTPTRSMRSCANRSVPKRRRVSSVRSATHRCVSGSDGAKTCRWSASPLALRRPTCGASGARRAMCLAPRSVLRQPRSSGERLVRRA